jgi:hypothetical protein
MHFLPCGARRRGIQSVLVLVVELALSVCMSLVDLIC